MSIPTVATSYGIKDTHSSGVQSPKAELLSDAFLRIAQQGTGTRSTNLADHGNLACCQMLVAAYKATTGKVLGDERTANVWGLQKALQKESEDPNGKMMRVAIDPNKPLSEQVRPGDIIVSQSKHGDSKHSAYGHGHTGIVGESGKMYSNSSANSAWMQNYTVKSWDNNYGTNYVYRAREGATTSNTTTLAQAKDAVYDKSTGAQRVRGGGVEYARNNVPAPGARPVAVQVSDGTTQVPQKPMVMGQNRPPVPPGSPAPIHIAQAAPAPVDHRKQTTVSAPHVAEFRPVVHYGANGRQELVGASTAKTASAALSIGAGNDSKAVSGAALGAVQQAFGDGKKGDAMTTAALTQIKKMLDTMTGSQGQGQGQGMGEMASNMFRGGAANEMMRFSMKQLTGPILSSGNSPSV